LAFLERKSKKERKKERERVREQISETLGVSNTERRARVFTGIKGSYKVI